MSVTTISIDAIGLSVRSVNALHRIEVHTVGQMMEYDEERLLQVRNLGQKSVKEILAKIEEYREKEVSGRRINCKETATINAVILFSLRRSS